MRIKTGHALGLFISITLGSSPGASRPMIGPIAAASTTDATARALLHYLAKLHGSTSAKDALTFGIDIQDAGTINSLVHHMTVYMYVTTPHPFYSTHHTS